jgi:hypothetical protein
LEFTKFTDNWCCINWKKGQKKCDVYWKCKGSVLSAGEMFYNYDERFGDTGQVKENSDNFDLISSFKITTESGPYWTHLDIYYLLLSKEIISRLNTNFVKGI